MGKGKLHAHHIIFQSSFEKNGQKFAKNAAHNLVVLCEEHHESVHRGEIIIDGYAESSEGRILRYRNADAEK